MKNLIKKKREQAQLRQRRVRSRLQGTAVCPRLTIKRSAKHIYAQLVDDDHHRTIIASSDHELPGDKIGRRAAAEAVGRILGEKAKAAGIKKFVMDRGPYRFHGRVAALTQAAIEICSSAKEERIYE